MNIVERRLVSVLAITTVLPLLTACPEPAEEPGEDPGAAPVEEPAAAPAEERAPEPGAAPTGDLEGGYVTNIHGATLGNEDYRRVLATGEHMQLVLMTLRPGEEIGQEMHGDLDQFFRVEAGTGRVTLDGDARELEAGSAVIIPAGVEHNLVNTGDEPLRLYTIYAPPEHEPGTVQRTKQEAEAAGH